MKHAITLVVRTLLAAARERAAYRLRKQSEVARPSRQDYRLNAGGWN